MARTNKIIPDKENTETKKEDLNDKKSKNDKKTKKVTIVEPPKIKTVKPPKIKIVKPPKIKQVKPKFVQNVLIINPKTHSTEKTSTRIFKVLSDTFYEYFDITKVNGMYYLRKLVTAGWIRVFWSVIPIGLMILAGTLIYLLYERYLSSPTRVTIGSPMPTTSVPFPGVTICHPQNVMEYKTKEFINKMKLPLGASKQRSMEILPLLAAFTEHQWTYPRIEDLEIIDEILDLNNLSVEDAINQLGTVCSDFILVCHWDGKRFPCFQKHKYLTWVESYSYLGACCSFNYHPNKDLKGDIFVANDFGINGGLSIIGTGRPQASDGKSGAIYSEGFEVITHHTNDFAVESASTVFLELSQETFVDVEPTYTSCSAQVLSLPFSQRNCIIPADRNVEIYRQPACMLECLRDEIHRRCQCHPFHLPTNNITKPIRKCRTVDALCFVENYFEFKNVKCSCYPSCTDVFYNVNSFKLPFKDYNYSINQFYFETNLTDQDFIVRVYFGGQTVLANRKIVVMSLIGLLSNLGGSFSLCLGISVLSFFEVIFFVTFRLIKHIEKVFQIRPPISRFDVRKH
ncbi:unnamed protein product [Diamesa tonsa]